MNQTKLVLVDDSDSLDNLSLALEKADVIAADFETSSLDYMSGYVVGISFAVKEGEGWYIPINHDEGEQLSIDVVVDVLKPILESDDKIIIAQNIKFDFRWLRKIGIDISTKNICDTLLEVFSLNDGPISFGLKYLAKYYFNHEMVEFDSLLSGIKDKNIGHVSIDLAAPYAAEDADYCLRIHNLTYGKIKNNSVYKLENALWPVVMKIEDTGFKADEVYLKAAFDYLRSEAEKVRLIILDQVEQILGKRVEFNPRSTKDCKEVIYDLMGLPVTLRTKTGPSTSEEALMILGKNWDFCKNILSYRGMMHASSLMYFSDKQSLRASIKSDGRVHTSYNQAGTGTGRFSSSSPNLQNQAVFKSWKVYNTDGSFYTVEISPRDALIAEDDYYLIEFDYKAIEFIVFAYEAGLQSIIDAYTNGLDVHKNTAADTLGKSIDDITKSERDIAKMQNYLVLYGGSSDTLSQKSGYSIDVCRTAIKTFFDAYPEFTKAINRIQKEASRVKYVSTHKEIIGGRHQIVPELKYGGPSLHSRGLRAAVSRVIQGSAADYQKVGLLKTSKESVKHWDWSLCHMVAQTHDSQTWEVHRSLLPQDVIPVLSEAMAWEIEEYPRIQVDAKVGISWGSMKDYDKSKNYDEVFGVLLNQRSELIKKLAGKKSFSELTTIENHVKLRNVIQIDLNSIRKDDFLCLIDVFRSNRGKTEVYFQLMGKCTKYSYPTSLSVSDIKSILDALHISDYRVEEKEIPHEDSNVQDFAKASI